MAISETSCATSEVEKDTPRDVNGNENRVDFDGPDDPENPLNWSSMKKFNALFLVSFMTFLSPLASTMIAPGTQDVMKEFQSTNEILASFVTTVYLLGYVCGPMVIAPLSELYGRVIVYQVCGVFFLIFNIACAVANNLAALIVFRLLAGVAGSSPVTLGAGSIADMIPRERRGLVMSIWVLGPLLGPTVAPIAGGYLSEAMGWRWIFWVLSIVTAVPTVLSFLLMRESYAYVILKRKTERLQKQTGNSSLRSVLDTGKSPRDLLVFSIIRPLKMLLFSPVVLFLSLYVSVNYSYLYLCFTTFPRVFERQYGFSIKQVGLSYLGIGVGSFLGLFLCGAVSDRLVHLLTERNGGENRPEYRLPTLAIGAFLVPTGLFWYGWTADHGAHWILPIIGTGFLGAGMVIAHMAVATYLVDAYTVYAASVTAATTILRSLLGALLPLAGNSMYNALGVGWGTSVLGFIAVAFIPLPFLFYTFGQRLRESRLFSIEF